MLIDAWESWLCCDVIKAFRLGDTLRGEDMEMDAGCAKGVSRL